GGRARGGRAPPCRGRGRAGRRRGGAGRARPVGIGRGPALALSDPERSHSASTLRPVRLQRWQGWWLARPPNTCGGRISRSGHPAAGSLSLASDLHLEYHAEMERFGTREEQTMTPQELRDTLRRQPFEPFRLVMTDGAGYDIRHPDLL